MTRLTRSGFALFLLSLAVAGADVHPGVERWPIKTSLPKGASISAPAKPISLADFLALADPPGVRNKDKRYQSERIPPVPGAKANEGDMVRTSGWLRLVAGEPDGDYHIQLTTAPDTFDNSLVVEAPKDDPAFVKDSPEVLKAAAAVRSFVRTKLLAGKDPTGRVLVIKGRAYVEVTGQLFFDDPHVAQTRKGKYRGKSIGGRKLPSKLVWEIHPVTGIRFAPQPK